MKIDNNIMINKIIDSDKNIYLIMDLCLFNLEEYINMRKEKLSIDEIKKILLDLNKSLKIMIENKIIHGNIKLTNILISLNQTNQLSFNLNIYDSIQFINKLDSMSITNQKPVLSNSPEILKGENISNKSDIWSLGIIIYYMLFNKFPYDDKTEYHENIILNQNKINNIEDKELKDLLIKMLKVDLNERISWDDYFNHLFFKTNKIFPKFNFICNNHSKQYNYCCINCKINICDDCLNNHLLHEIIPFNEIGFNNEELNKIEYLLNNIENNITILNKMKKDIELFKNKMKNNKNNMNIYENNIKYNFKQYYIDCLDIINKISKIEDKINLIEFKENYILCKYNVLDENINKPIQILNCLD